MKFAIGAFENHPMRSRAAVLADPLDQSAVRLDGLEGMGTSVSHGDISVGDDGKSAARCQLLVDVETKFTLE